MNKDVTLLIIAHRLQTIMDVDKIVGVFAWPVIKSLTFAIQMVLDEGRIVSRFVMILNIGWADKI